MGGHLRGVYKGDNFRYNSRHFQEAWKQWTTAEHEAGPAEECEPLVQAAFHQKRDLCDKY